VSAHSTPVLSGSGIGKEEKALLPSALGVVVMEKKEHSVKTKSRK
jgi:hypothetical protein